VSVDGSGAPFRIVDVDRIFIARKGDYSFAVAGPVETVSGVPGSSSQPGLRTGAVVWQGFSPARRTLAAEITLVPRVAASALPLRVEVGQSGLRLVNATSATTSAVDTRLPALPVARVLDAAREGLATGVSVSAPLVTAVGPLRNAPVTVYLPLSVRGTVRFAGAPAHRIAAFVGRTPLRIPGTGKLETVELSVSVPDPAAVLRPPGARSWVDAARSGRVHGGQALTRLAVNRLLAAGLAVQFHELLANPDASGTSKTTYHYALAEQPQTVAAAHASGGRDWVAPVALGLALTVAALACLVLWAHS
jgi:hypothetical protein